MIKGIWHVGREFQQSESNIMNTKCYDIFLKFFYKLDIFFLQYHWSVSCIVCIRTVWVVIFNSNKYSFSSFNFENCQIEAYTITLKDKQVSYFPNFVSLCHQSTVPRIYTTLMYMCIISSTSNTCILETTTKGKNKC